jgi:Trp operon repressor
MYDWETIRAEYVAGDASYKDLAAKYGVSYKQITTRGNDEKWAAERQKVREKAANRAADIVARQKARSLANVMLAADKLADRIQLNVDILDNARDTSDIAKALKYTIDTIHQVYGIQTPAQLHRQKMDEEKLKLERERLEMDRKRQDTESHADPVRIMIVQPGEETGDA